MRARAFPLILAVLWLFAAAGARASELGFERLERALRLDPLQQHQFQVAAKATQRALLTIGLGVLQVKLRLGQELLKDRPDPSAIERAQDELVEMSRPHVRAARDEWLRLYAMLDEEQVATARAFIDERMRQVEKLAQYMGEQISREFGRP